MINKKFKNPKRKNLKIFVVIIIISLILTSNFFLIGTKPKNPKYFTPQNKEEEIKEKLANQKGYFTKNQGQLENDEIYFSYTSSDKSFGFSESSVLIKLSKNLDDNKTKSSIIKLTFENSNIVVPIGKEELSHKSNYFIGNDKSKWKNKVTNFEKIIYENLYDGIDLVYYFNENGLKYDWVVNPNANPNNIIERFEGINSIEIDSKGKLVIKSEAGDLKEDMPYSYQKFCENLVEIKTSYRFIGNNRITYNIGNYDSSKDLIIDPLIYSTFVGGFQNDYGYNIKLDSDNNVYVVGTTYSSDFPTTSGCFDDLHNENWDVFVFKLNPDGSDLLYSTFIGGSKDDEGRSIALDNEKNVYITGRTESSAFPTTSGCFDDIHNGECDIFVFKLNSEGSSLLYSTFVGGSKWENGYAISLDSNNSAYVTGLTSSLDFPVTSNCYDDSNNKKNDIFVFKLKSDGSDLLYSTFIGGSHDDVGSSIAIDSEDNAYITGDTESLNFPTTPGCYDDSYNKERDVFVLKLNSNGSSLLFSTFAGGNRADEGYDIAVDSNNYSYITGCTYSSDFPTTSGCYDDSYYECDVFVFKLNQDGSDLVYSTFVGESGADHGYNIVLDSENNAFVTGETASSDFPTTSGCYDDSHNGGSDVFVFKLNSDGSDLLYSTFIGGSDDDKGWGIALGTKKILYITGYTCSSNFPTTTNCFDNSYNHNNDVFILKLNLDIVPIVNIIFPSNGTTICKTSKTLSINGTASVAIGKIIKVQIKIDDNEWQDAKGINNWIYEWDLTKVEEGNHTISVRGFDGKSFSEIETIDVLVEEGKKIKESYKTIYIILIIGIISVVCIIGFVSYSFSSKNKTPQPFQPLQMQQQYQQVRQFHSQTPPFQPQMKTQQQFPHAQKPPHQFPKLQQSQQQFPLTPQPTSPPLKSQHSCLTCRHPLRYIEQYQSWYCDTCRRYVKI